ncbi:hypothetical protein [Pseudonocardia abyssalis]|uniref:Uncharacterized protein n=1 Tax=Pseudonocardia abyssalis TaxID=2792008 RepID=A0ABS6ULL8_9PSEU|nr:hypothetical protein [Pseudonocardia abyssalis]MBW0119548.1 hypothetical protein [Pseudonocardia abyssalis]MBW0133122.1 hypothetical protein [Pseudonocardia abyssalis]
MHLRCVGSQRPDEPGSDPRAAWPEIEALAFLVAPVDVVIEVDGVRTRERLPAGVSATRAPLAPGAVGAEAVRGGVVVATVRSPWEVGAAREVQDLGYRFTASTARCPYGCDRTAGRVEVPVPPAPPGLARC